MATWSDLRTRAPALPQRLQLVAGFPAHMDHPPLGTVPADILGAAARTLSEATVLLGPAGLAPHFEVLTPRVAPALEAVDPRGPGRVMTVVTAGLYVLGAEHIDLWPAGSHDHVLRAWLAVCVDRQPPVAPDLCPRVALLALALGVDPAPYLAGRDPLTAQVRALQAGDTDLPAFLTTFPDLEARGMLTFSDLQAAARFAFAMRRGLPVSWVGAALAEAVAALP